MFNVNVWKVDEGLFFCQCQPSDYTAAHHCTWHNVEKLYSSRIKQNLYIYTTKPTFVDRYIMHVGNCPCLPLGLGGGESVSVGVI